MNIESLNTFVTLAKTLNYTQAANRLYIAQSTVTNRINELESELNIQLFHRTKRTVSLTIAGEKFLIYAQKVLDITNIALSEISSENKFTDSLRVGSADSIYEAHLISALNHYRVLHPNCAIKISIGQSANLIEQLTDNILDVVFSYLPLKKVNYSCSIFKEDKMTLVTSVNNIAFTSGILKSEFLDVNYIMCNFALQDVGAYIRRLFPKYHQFSLEIDDCSKVIPYLIESDTYTFLPEDMANHYIQKKLLRKIPLIDFEIPIIRSYIIMNKTLKNDLQSFLNIYPKLHT